MLYAECGVIEGSAPFSECRPEIGAHGAGNIGPRYNAFQIAVLAYDNMADIMLLHFVQYSFDRFFRVGPYDFAAHYIPGRGGEVGKNN